MRIISRRSLREFTETLAGSRDYPAVKDAIDVWFKITTEARWANASEVKRHFASANIINSERIVFNIKGNDYRLVVAVDFEKFIIWIKWIGTHREYDKIDVAKVQYNG